MSIDVTMPPKPQWWFIQGHNGMITYNTVWLAANALDYRIIFDGLEVRLEYLSIEEMPILFRETGTLRTEFLSTYEDYGQAVQAFMEKYVL